jgi:hypothetical protein
VVTGVVGMALDLRDEDALRHQMTDADANEG